MQVVRALLIMNDRVLKAFRCRLAVFRSRWGMFVSGQEFRFGYVFDADHNVDCDLLPDRHEQVRALTEYHLAHCWRNENLAADESLRPISSMPLTLESARAHWFEYN
ncbi:MAG: hypothetical protein ACRD22_16825, partial [Terriglobia bacterium]